MIANSFQGRQLNRPNDVVVKSDGCIYFTDPWTSPAAPEQWDLTFSGVYRVTPDLGSLTLLIADFIIPNGLAFSPDEKVLYINDSRRGHIRAFDMMPNGTLAKQTDRVFADLRGSEPGVPDGMKVDTEGNVYCGGAGGIWIMDPAGKKLGRIVHGATATTNVGFGGDDWKTLYFTAATTWVPFVKIAGIPVPGRETIGLPALQIGCATSRHTVGRTPNLAHGTHDQRSIRLVSATHAAAMASGANRSGSGIPSSALLIEVCAMISSIVFTITTVMLAAMISATIPESTICSRNGKERATK